MVVYNRYVNNKDHTWYDSSNVVYSLCYDNNEATKNLKIVFKNGRTYLYKNVDVNDYIGFRSGESTGKTVNQYIVKKYQGVRLPDTDMEKLDELKEEFINDNKITEEAFTNLAYHLSVNDITGDFALKLNGKTIYRGVEGQVSILNLLKCMNINFSMSEDYEPEEDNIEDNELKKEEEKTMNNVDKQYLDLLQDIMDNGVYKETRSGAVRSVFGRMMRFNLQNGLPILTTKKVFTNGIIHELLWFLKAGTNIKYLIDNNVHIWDDDAYRYYKEICKKYNEKRYQR